MSDAELAALRDRVREDTKLFFKQNLDAAYDRLFPNAQKGSVRSQVTQEDINALKTRFQKITMDIICDRNARRAHRYEKRKTDATVKMLSLKRIEELFEAVEQIINDIRLVVTNSTFIYNPPIWVNKVRTAQDTVDMILHGTINQLHVEFGISADHEKANLPYYYQYRAKYYKQP